MQFGVAEPGGTAEYHKVLYNRSMDTLGVNLSGRSRQGWDMTVDPTHVVAEPNTPYQIDITVEVPISPTRGYDMEQIMAVTEGAMPHTTTARIITIVDPHAFSDLAREHWATGPVQYLVAEGVVTGYADGTFRPDAYVTRAQFAKMIVGAMGWELHSPETPTFSDVAPDHWAYAYIETAAARGILSGYADGTFRPISEVTRAQVAKMIHTSRGWPTDVVASTTFSDVSPADWFYSYVQAASAAEVLSGYTDGTFRPYAPATRAQIAKIITMGLFSDPNE